MLFAALTAAAFVSLTSAAAASFHDVQIRAVFRGPTAVTGFIELQTTAPGQNLVNGQLVKVFNENATLSTNFTLNANVPNAESQRTILIGNTATAPTPDFTAASLFMTLNNVAAGGALCYGTIDCVSWGAFTGNALLPSSAGTPAGQLLTSQVTARGIGRGCATALDTPDDTNDSAADFGLTVGYLPRNNAAAPTEVLCPLTPKPTPPKAKKCKKKKKKARASAKKCKKKRKK